MRVLAKITLVLGLLVLAAPIVHAQVPEGGAIRNKELEMDRGVKALLSETEVLAAIQKAIGRFGGKLSKITVSEKTLTESVYRFHFSRKSTSQFRKGPGFFTAEVRFGREGEVFLKKVSEVIFAR
jgi:hypothetical protein